MRISDWSSDVCSSDLRAREAESAAMAANASAAGSGDGEEDLPAARAVYRHELSGLRLSLILRSAAVALILLWLFIGLRQAAWFYVPLLGLFVASAAAACELKRRRRLSGSAHLAFYAVDATLLTFVLLVADRKST